MFVALTISIDYLMCGKEVWFPGHRLSLFKGNGMIHLTKFGKIHFQSDAMYQYSFRSIMPAHSKIIIDTIYNM